MRLILAVVAYAVLVTFVIGPVVGHWIETTDKYDRED
jgi:hypothetical protein